MDFLRQRKAGEEKKEEEKKTEIAFKAAEEKDEIKTHRSKITSMDSKRVEKLLTEVAGKSPPWLANVLSALIPFLKFFIEFINIAGPPFVALVIGLYKIYTKLPHTIITMLCGLGLCFFGGYFALSIAAIEAFNATGGGQVYQAIADIKIDLKALHKANKEDDERDDDGDGIRDVDQISSKDLLTRKLSLALKTVSPDRLSNALSGLYTGYMGVLVVLKFQFARTVSLAISIGDCMKPLACDYIAPSLAYVIPKDYHQWIKPLLNFICKSIAMTIAWWIQRIISTVQSAIRGGLMFSRAVLRFANEKGLTKLNHEDTNLDEIVGWALAAGGAYFQITSNWDLPFVVDVFFFPLHLLEWWLRWSVTWMNTHTAAAPPA